MFTEDKTAAAVFAETERGLAKSLGITSKNLHGELVELNDTETLAAPGKDCECHKEKFGFIGHERWCPDFVPFNMMGLQAKPEPAKVEDFKTLSDLAAFCHPDDR